MLCYSWKHTSCLTNVLANLLCLCLKEQKVDYLFLIIEIVGIPLVTGSSV